MKKAGDLAALVEKIAERAKSKPKHSKPGEPAAPDARVVQLPLWPEPARGVPNGILRSALFGVVKRGKRKYIDNELIASLDGVEISYAGQSLDQNDLGVYEAILHIARTQRLGDECYFTAYSLLKILGVCPRRRPKNCQSYPQVQNLYNDNLIRLCNDQIVKFSASGRLKRPPAA